MFLTHNMSYAFTKDFVCENCAEKVMVPFAASNTYQLVFFFIFLFRYSL